MNIRRFVGVAITATATLGVGVSVATTVLPAGRPAATTVDAGGDSPACRQVWLSDQAYGGGTVVSHDGANYRTRWWTRAENPSTATWVWEYVEECGTAKG